MYSVEVLEKRRYDYLDISSNINNTLVLFQKIFLSKSQVYIVISRRAWDGIVIEVFLVTFNNCVTPIFLRGRLVGTYEDWS